MLNNGADINDMSMSQHNSFTKITGNDIWLPGPVLDTNSININTVFTGGAASTTQNTIETYTIDNVVGTNNNYRVGGSNQTVTDSDVDGSTVLILGGLSSTTLNTASGNDTVTINGGSTGITVDTNAGDDTVNATAGGTNITIITDGKDTVNLGGTHTGLSVSTDIDADIVSVAAGSSLAGTINVGTGDDTLILTSGDYSAVTFLGMGNGGTDTVKMSGGSYTFTGDQYTNLITAATTTLDQSGAVPGDYTIHISNASNVAFSNELASLTDDTGKFNTLVMDSSGSDWVTFTSVVGATLERYLDISAGGADKLTIYNDLSESYDSDSELVVDGFDVTDDQLELENDVGSSGTFQEITTGQTDLTIGASGVVEINTVVGAFIGAAGAQDCSEGGQAESLIAAAIGGTVITGDDFFVVAYGSDGAAYIYEVDLLVADGNLGTGDFDVELVGQLNDVGVNSLALGNFFSV